MIQQNTPEWLELRRGMIGASDAPIILGVSPYKDRYTLWKEKTGMQDSPPMNFAMGVGHDLEPQIVAMAEIDLGMKFTPYVVISKKYRWMMASLDGLSECGRIGLEVKYNNKVAHEETRSGVVPAKHYAQLQHQIICADLDHAFYYSFNSEEGIYLRVQRDEAYCNELLQVEEEFFRCVENFEMPALLEKDYLDRHDLEWSEEAANLKAIRESIKALDAKEAASRDKLISMAAGRNTRGGGITVTGSTPKGSVDYKSIPELAGVDLERYRKPGRERWTVK